MKRIYTSFILILFATSSFTTYTSLRSSTYDQIVSNTDVKEYEGTYSFEDDSPVRKFTITSKDNDLYGEADSYGANKLLKQAEADTYLSTSTYGSTIIFTRDPSTKKVTGLRLIIQGSTLQAIRDN